MVDSKVGAGKGQGGSGVSYSTKKEVLKRQKDKSISKGHGDQPERSLSCQGWNNVSNKINSAVLDCYPRYTINTHEIVL
jgi:hypothetical protein